MANINQITDPLFVASAASTITGTMITNWNTAFGWGNHALAGYATASNVMTFTNKSGNISQWTNDSGYLTSVAIPNLQQVTTAGSTTTVPVTIFSDPGAVAVRIAGRADGLGFLEFRDQANTTTTGAIFGHSTGIGVQGRALFNGATDDGVAVLQVNGAVRGTTAAYASGGYEPMVTNLTTGHYERVTTANLLAGETLQAVTNRGNHTSNSIYAGSGAGAGYVQLSPGAAGATGWVGFYKPDNTRLGYIGESASDMLYAAENGSRHSFIGGRIVSQGSLHIGVDNPNYVFSAQGSAGPGNAHSYINNTNTADDTHGLVIDIGSNNATSYPFIVRSGTSIDRLAVRADGNVGIGTQTPTAKLHVASEGSAPRIATQIGSGIMNEALFLIGLENGNSFLSAVQEAVGGGNLILQGSNAAVGAYGGNVGIGTDIPATTLHVNGIITTSVGIYSESGNDLILWAQNGTNMNFFCGTSGIKMSLDNSGLFCVGGVPQSARASIIQAEGNVWATDAYILGTGTTPLAEFGMAGAGAFVRTMTPTAELTLQTNTITRAYFNPNNYAIGFGPGNSSPSHVIDITSGDGYSQLRLRQSYTPTGSADANGTDGTIAWDTNFIYVKTGAGAWKRAALSTF